MSDYSVTYSKNAGDTIVDTDFETEFASIATAITSKYDSTDLIDDDTMAAATAVNFSSAESIKAYVDSRQVMGTPYIASGAAAFNDWTGIPSGCKRITISISKLDITTGTAPSFYIRLGDAGGLETSAYDYTISRTITTAVSVSSASADTFGYVATSILGGGSKYNGRIVLTLVDATNFVWAWDSLIGEDIGARMWAGVGSKTLSAELTQLRFGEGGTSPSLDTGTINILYEV